MLPAAVCLWTCLSFPPVCSDPLKMPTPASVSPKVKRLPRPGHGLAVGPRVGLPESTEPCSGLRVGAGSRGRAHGGGRQVGEPPGSGAPKQQMQEQ